MQTRKSKVFPVVLTVLILVIIIYLFSTLKQPYVECSSKKQTDANVLVKENIKATLDSNKISKLEVVKTIILGDEYKDNYKKYTDSIKYSLEASYKYLGKGVRIETEDNKVIVRIIAEKGEKIILNDINFYNNDNLEIEIESNTKSSDVVTLGIKDKYTEGELLTRMKNNGYSCK